MAFGGQTVTFVTVTETGTVDGLGSPVLVRTNIDVPGCRHRPLSAAETPEWLTDIGTQIWNTTAPPEAAAIAAKSTGELIENGVTYRIIGGARPFTDMAGIPFKVSILSQIVEA